MAAYRRHERFLPAVFFLGGVSWDAATLRRIDAVFDNALLFGYLVVLGGLILLAVLEEGGRLAWPWVVRHRAWLPPAIQFFMGALFSAYVVYYFQSASLTSTSVFLFLLVGLLVANEFIHRKLLNLYLLFVLYYLVVFSFFVFFVPILLKVMSYWTFLLGGVLSLGIVVGMLLFLRRCGVFEEMRPYRIAVSSVAGLFVLLNVLYVADLMPPVPLAMRYGGVFHEVERRGDAYLLRYERPPWYAFWVRSDATYRYTEGDRVYCFAAIYAPAQLSKEIHHAWYRYDERLRRWVATDTIAYEILGYDGRTQGFRGYTYKRNLAPGRWRVDVQTRDGHTLGRIRFEITPAASRARDLVERAYH